MIAFSYQAVDTAGRTRHGQLRASDAQAATAQLLGKRVRVVPVEQVLRGYKKGEGWPKDPTTMGLMPGVRPPRNWRSPVDQ